jgi:hypothetical protein
VPARHELLCRLNDDRAALLFALDGELDDAVDQRKQGVILAHADVVARVEFGTALANDDVAGFNQLTAVALDAKSFGF